MSIAKTTRPYLLTREAAAARIEELEKHKRLQTEDVMNLGAQLGQAWLRIEQLEVALREIMLQNVEPYCREIARAALAPEQDNAGWHIEPRPEQVK